MFDFLLLFSLSAPVHQQSDVIHFMCVCECYITGCGQHFMKTETLNWFVLFSASFNSQLVNMSLFSILAAVWCRNDRARKKMELNALLILFRIHWVWTEQWQFPVFLHNFWIKTNWMGFHKFDSTFEIKLLSSCLFFTRWWLFTENSCEIRRTKMALALIQ